MSLARRAVIVEGIRGTDAGVLVSSRPGRYAPSSIVSVSIASPGKPRRLLQRVVSGVFVVLFVLAAAVQWNDPDPVLWIAIYGVAALVSGIAILRVPLPRQLLLAVGGLSVALLALATSRVPTILRTSPPWGEVWSDVRMVAPGVEEARECLGLLIVVGWFLFLAVQGWRAAK